MTNFTVTPDAVPKPREQWKEYQAPFCCPPTEMDRVSEFMFACESCGAGMHVDQCDPSPVQCVECTKMVAPDETADLVDGPVCFDCALEIAEEIEREIGKGKRP